MATKVLTTNLRMGMFVAELDRPWTDTPFLLQGFLIDSDDQIRELQKHCEFVIVDRARSVGKEFQPTAEAQRPAPAQARSVTIPGAASAPGKAKGNGADVAPAPERPVRAKPAETGRRVVRLEDIAARRDSAYRGAAPDEPQGDYPGLLGRVLSGFKGMWSRDRGPESSG